MKNKFYNHINNLLLPCLIFSVLTGVFSTLIVTAFKIISERIIRLSNEAFQTVRANPTWLPLLVIGITAIGFMASLVLSITHSCRGGGIPTSIAAVKGIVNFKWVTSVTLLPLSSFLTYLAGLPLGTEGPCVQMCTAVGDGVSKCIGKEKHKGWRRYIMTGGASAGFSIATASPITAVVFSIEELHKKFSPMLLSVVSVSVMTAQVTARVLAHFGIGSVEFFHLPQIEALGLTMLFAPLIVGIVTGLCSILFTLLYRIIDNMMRIILKKISVKVVFPVIFALSSVVGFLLADTLGSGHSLVDSLFTYGAAWYTLILVFLIRALGMMISNTSGATGGIFLPTLAFGAIIGALCANGMIALGWISTEHYLIIVVLGIISFLGATSRIPLTACFFAIEALNGINNVLPIIISVTVAFLIVESSDLEDLSDAIIEAKLHKITKGKKAITIEVPLTVARDSFATGKELRDILWPNSCVVLSFKRANKTHGHPGLSDGDIITVHYVTYEPRETMDELIALVGEQSQDIVSIMNPTVQ